MFSADDLWRHVFCALPSTLPLVVVCVLCLLQWGLTPVLRAAYGGQPNIIDLLVNLYNGSLNDVSNVSGV